MENFEGYKMKTIKTAQQRYKDRDVVYYCHEDMINDFESEVEELRAYIAELEECKFDLPISKRIDVIIPK